MGHNSRCETASKTAPSECQCPCEGRLHGIRSSSLGRTSSGNAGTSSIGSEASEISKSANTRAHDISELDDSTKTVVKGAIVGGVLATHPELVPAYKAYKAGKIGKKLYDSSDKNELKRVVTKQTATEASTQVTEKDASKIAGHVRRSFLSSGGSDHIFGKGGEVNDEIYATMLEGSVKGGIQSGSAELTEYGVEVAI